jgi:ABC-type transport system involved in multi-copper enzyme maturation permease subunit
MSRILLVASHVFKENVRDRVLYAIAGFALLLVSASVLIGQLTAGQDVKIIKDLGLAVIEFAGVLMSIFIGVGLVAREIERRSIHSLLAKPLPRWEFIVGKYVGLVLTLVVNVALMTVVLYGMLAYMAAISPDAVQRSWDAPAIDPGLLVQVALITAELALLTAIALLFSTFSSSALLSMGFTLGVFIAGLESQDLRGFGDIVDAPGVAWLVTAIGWIVPAFSIFSETKGEIVHGIVPASGAVLSAVGYAAVYVAAALAAAVAIFSRREFK